jgi:hypothetical protein
LKRADPLGSGERKSLKGKLAINYPASSFCARGVSHQPAAFGPLYGPGLADRLDGRVAQPLGGSEELGPTRLHISWNSEQHSDTAVVEAASSSVLAIAAPAAQSDD